MSYEKSLITDSPSAIPSQPSQPAMREELVIEPFKPLSQRLAKASEAVAAGRATINSEQPVRPEVSSATPEETVTLSPQMAALARKEQRFRQRELEVKKRSESLDAERAEIQELKALKAKLAAKDYSGIEDLVKYDEYTQYLIEKTNGVSPQEEAVKKLALEVEGLKTAQKTDVEKRFEAEVSRRRDAVKTLVQTDPKFSKIKKAKAEEAVVQHILDTWEHDNKDLSPEEAAKEVEEVLAEKANQWKALLENEVEQAHAQVAGEKKQLPPLKAPIKTITNQMAASGEIKRPLKSFAQMSDSERYAEARRRAEEKLKQGIK